MATYDLPHATHVSVGGREADWPAGPHTAESDFEESILAALAARGAATLVADPPAAEPEPDPEPAVGPPDTEV